jgi:hypothetical protein
MAITKVTNRVLEVDSVGTAQLSAGAITNVKLSADVRQILGVPVGAVMSFARNTAPTGWLVCDGSGLSTSTYSALFAAIQYLHGGSGSNFNIPDLRGLFIRGSGSSVVGSTTHTGTFAQRQADAIRDIVGYLGAVGNQPASAFGASFSGALFSYGRGNCGGAGGGGTANNCGSIGFEANRIVPTDYENRPANVALLYCIKWN